MVELRNLFKAALRLRSMKENKGHPVPWIVLGVAVILIAIVFISNSNKQKYVCQDGAVVSDASLCPRNPKLVIVTECSTTWKNPLGAGGFPDIVKGEFNLRAVDASVSNVRISYSLYGRSDNSLKYSDSRYIGTMQIDSEKTILFGYEPQDLNEIFTGETGFPGGIVGMNLKLKAECDGCELEGSMETFCAF